MNKEDYLYYMVKIVYSSMVQSTLAIENYIDTTQGAFNKRVLNFYDEFFDYYNKTLEHFKKEDDNIDAELMCFLRRSKEENKKRTLDYIQENIIKKADISYNVIEKFSEYENDKSTNNSFAAIIHDLRCMSEKNISRKEDNDLRKIDIVWYDAKTLDELHICIKNDSDENGEIGGHLMRENISDDLSYLTTREDREQLFREVILGESSDAD